MQARRRRTVGEPHRAKCVARQPAVGWAHLLRMQSCAKALPPTSSPRAEMASEYTLLTLT
eukprot:12893903-Heterocapsa_arctica.AAC.1